MRRWKLGLILVFVSAIGLLVWGYLSLGIYVPRVHVVHLETPGGPVPVAVTFLDPDSAYIRVGHDAQPRDDRMESGANGTIHIRDVDWSPFDFELEFPWLQTRLEMSTVHGADGRDVLVGVLRASDGTEIHARSQSVTHQNWFDDVGDEVQPATNRVLNGNWVLNTQLGSEVAQMRLESYRQREDLVARADAEVLTFLSLHRNFNGIITGNRIRLASFDNAYPALIDATIQDDGTLKGDFWIGDRLHESFVGTRE